MSKTKYKVAEQLNGKYVVSEIKITDGERLDAYNSLPSTHETKSIFSGSPTDCYAIIKLKEEGYLK
jgi:hypothetical protein